MNYNNDLFAETDGTKDDNEVQPVGKLLSDIDSVHPVLQVSISNQT